MKIQKIAIVGQGQFGKFMMTHLEKHFEIVPFSRVSNPETLRTCDAVVFAVPFSSLEAVIIKVCAYIPPHTLILDVTSVKQKPIAILKRYFKTQQIIGTHPIFGPQSGKISIEGLPIVLCNISAKTKTYTSIKRFLKHELKLRVIEQTPKEHDHQMANIQALTHFIGRALINLKIANYPTNTKSYEHLLELCDILSKDSWELFKTIQNTNAEAKKIRKRFVAELINLEKKLLN